MNKNNNYFEIIVGTFVLFCAIFFFVSSFRSAKVGTSSGYQVIAKFDNADGISGGSDVKIAGIKIGSVVEQSLDVQNYRAVLHLNITNGVAIPSDSSAKISSEGLLGSKYISISPGGDEENLKSGDEIEYTQSSVNFEDLLGKFIFSANDKKEAGKNDKK